MTVITPQIEHHMSANANISRKEIMLNNFLGGLAWGFGTVVGATVVVAILGFILNLLGVFDAFKMIFGQPSVPPQSVSPASYLYQ